ncbi:MAG TPA: D-alanyl-D-alanine carboxypeptidase/D-alanyl-D-alanine-endopeptidase [Kofleriaceae bacterium]|jgi:D-alanyl-D-alanine carboxypeptidase/D-alanyl-D-alanine-endopeptidase (penicillin-binding protein 4)
MRALLLAAALAFVSSANAAPVQRKPVTRTLKAPVVKAAPIATRAVAPPRKRIPLSKKGIAARIAFTKSGELRTSPDVIGRRAEPLTLEEQTAKRIEALMRGPLRSSLTGLYVADAKTGQPIFSVNADEPLNPASNVKMISTATSLELLGADFRYPTRVLGPEPIDGVVHGDVYLLGSYDPTLTATDLDDLAGAVAVRGIKEVDGDIVVGSDPVRDGIYRAVIPIEVTAGENGAPPTAASTIGADHVSIVITAKTARSPMRPRLTYSAVTTKSATGIPLITLTIGGVMGKGGSSVYQLATKERTATAAYALRAALRAKGVAVQGDYKIAELGDFTGEAIVSGNLPVELARHESKRLAEIIAQVNKFSINWLADRVVLTATALARHQAPSMDASIDAMYSWLERNAHIQRKDLLIDTGSGLSYKTEITTTELVAIVRAAAGFMNAVPASSTPTIAPVEDPLAKAWIESLSIAGTDGTLRHRVRNATARIRGKTGTLSTAIAMSGIMDIDPDRPLVFSLVTNTDTPLAKPYIRKAHDRVVGELCHYLAATQHKTSLPSTETTPTTGEPPDDNTEETAPHDDALDAEAAGAK